MLEVLVGGLHLGMPCLLHHMQQVHSIAEQLDDPGVAQAVELPVGIPTQLLPHADPHSIERVAGDGLLAGQEVGTHQV